MTNFRALRGFVLNSTRRILTGEVFEQSLVENMFSAPDINAHGRDGDPRQLWETTEDDVFIPSPTVPPPLTATNVTVDVDLSVLTMTQFDGTSYVDITSELEFVSPQSANGKVVIYDGKLTRVGTIGILTFKLEYDRDDPTRVDFSNILPDGGEILAVPYPITDNSSYDFADESEISTSIQNQTEVHLDRRDGIDGVMFYKYMMTIGGY